jgi:orotidine-5'-phosphate decarboxylase
MTFIDKLREIQGTNRSYVCIGLDPDISKMPPGFGQSGTDILAFCNAIIDSTADLVSAYKANLAFYLAHGAVGIDTLRQVIAHVPAEIPTILDAKFGDIGNTAAHYAAFAFEQIRADAVTLSPYIGTDAIQPFIAHPRRFAFVLARTSNVQGNEFQQWPDPAAPLYRRVAEQMGALEQGHPDQIGLVVGATQPAELEQIRGWVPDLPFLVPGIGAQGGDLVASIRHGMSRSGLGPVINVGRDVLYASQGSDFAQAARDRVLALREEIDGVRKAL